MRIARIACLCLAAAACRASGPQEGRRPLRVAVRATPQAVERLSPLSYRGGFQAKSMVYETLVRRDAEGRIAPGLAQAWECLDDGRTLRLRLRQGARFHDGSPVTADAVALHFRRWVGLPEHAWLGATTRIQRVVAEDESTLRIELDRPWALLDELCALNPCAIQAPAAIDREGVFTQPLGSGRFRFAGAGPRGALRFELAASEAAATARAVELVPFAADEPDAAVDALLRGRIDLALDGWYEHVPRERVAALRARAELEVFEGPGSSVWYLSFRLAGPTASPELRRALRASIDRRELIDACELGFADPATAWAARSLRDWPGRSGEYARPGPAQTAPLRLVVARESARERRLGQSLAAQWRRAGWTIEVAELEASALAQRLGAGEYDLRLERTWGVPYDPWLSLFARFAPPPAQASAASQRFHGVDAQVQAWVTQAAAIADERQRGELARRIQERLDSEALIVPLYVPRRLGVARRAAHARPALDHDLYRTELADLAQERLER